MKEISKTYSVAEADQLHRVRQELNRLMGVDVIIQPPLVVSGEEVVLFESKK